MGEAKSAFLFNLPKIISTEENISLGEKLLSDPNKSCEMITKSDDISRWWEKAASVITSGRDLVQEVELLKNMYTLRRSDEVSSFLNDNEDLARILADAYEKIRKHFPSEEIFLEIFRDPSSPGDKEVLVSVSTSLAPKEAIGKLDLFDDEWYLIDANIPNLNMCVKVEYK